MEKLEITKEKVLEAAAKCSTAKATLEALFPEVFKTDEVPDIEDFMVNHEVSDKLIFIARGFAPYGLADKCFGLNPDYSWTLESKSNHQLLVPQLNK